MKVKWVLSMSGYIYKNIQKVNQKMRRKYNKDRGIHFKRLKEI